MNIANPKMKLYFDTSALVKEFVNETGSAEVKQYVVEKVHQEDVVFSTAVITKAEIAAALSAMRRNRELTQPKLDEAVSRFQKRWKLFNIVNASLAVIEKSYQIGLQHKIKGSDAFQLASALIDGTELLISCDQDLNAAAKKEGIQVWNPMNGRFEPIKEEPEPSDYQER